MNKFLARASVALGSVAAFVLSPLSAFAQVEEGLTGSQNTLTTIGSELGQSDQDLPTLIGNIINVLLGVLGIILVVIIVYAGYLYLTSAGEPEKVKKAKGMIAQAVIGLVIIVAAYAISSFVIDALVQVTTA